jgi:ABC-type transporter Mla subunit MlaD
MAEFLEAYLVEARFFALVHLVLTVVVFSLLTSFVFWKPGKSEKALAELDARSQHLRGVIGLFLLVGIAGTFYALWVAKDKLGAPPPATAFADTSDGSVTAHSAPASIGAVLAPAFPVGLVGLALTFGFSLVLDFVEHAKRSRIVRRAEESAQPMEALVGRALEQLGRLLESDRSETRVTLDRGFATLEGALRPVADLQRTLSASLEPVVRELARSLDASTDLLREQGRRLDTSASSLASAAGELTRSAHDIGEAVASLSGVTASAVAAHESARRLSAETEATLEAARKALGGVVDQTADLHNQVGAQLGVLRTGVVSTVEGLRETPRLLAATLEQQSAVLREATRQHITESLRQTQEGFARAANDFASAIATNRAVIEEILHRVEAAEAHHTTLQRAVADEGRRSVSELTLAFRDVIDEGGRAAMTPIATLGVSVRESGEEIGRASKQLQDRLSLYEAEMTSQRDALARTTQSLGRGTAAVSQAIDVLASTLRSRAPSLESAPRARSLPVSEEKAWRKIARRLWPFGGRRSSRR